jgi:hypothetical protein
MLDTETLLSLDETKASHRRLAGLALREQPYVVRLAESCMSNFLTKINLWSGVMIEPPPKKPTKGMAHQGNAGQATRHPNGYVCNPKNPTREATSSTRLTASVVRSISTHSHASFAGLGARESAAICSAALCVTYTRPRQQPRIEHHLKTASEDRKVIHGMPFVARPYCLLHMQALSWPLTASLSKPLL